MSNLDRYLRHIARSGGFKTVQDIEGVWSAMAIDDVHLYREIASVLGEDCILVREYRQKLEADRKRQRQKEEEAAAAERQRILQAARIKAHPVPVLPPAPQLAKPSFIGRMEGKYIVIDDSEEDEVEVMNVEHPASPMSQDDQHQYEPVVAETVSVEQPVEAIEEEPPQTIQCHPQFFDDTFGEPITTAEFEQWMDSM